MSFIVHRTRVSQSHVQYLNLEASWHTSRPRDNRHIAGSIYCHCRWTMMMMTTTSRILVPVQQVTERMVSEHWGAERVGVTHGTGQVSHTTSITATSTAHWSVGFNLSIDSVSWCRVHAWPAMLVASALILEAARRVHL
jgi:hypothetical protein